MDITVDQIRDLIKAEKFKPSDFFGAEVLADDPSVKGLIETETRRAVAGEYAHRKRTEEGFDKTRTDLEAKLKERDTELQNLRIETASSKVKAIFASQKVARKLTDKQSAFIEDRLSKFKPTKPEDVDKEFNLHLDSEVDEYKKVAKLLGVEDAAAGGGEAAPEAGKAVGGVTGPTESSIPASAAPDKYLDPAKNPFIKLD
jgi:hypothetical protein